MMPLVSLTGSQIYIPSNRTHCLEQTQGQIHSFVEYFIDTLLAAHFPIRFTAEQPRDLKLL